MHFGKNGSMNELATISPDPATGLARIKALVLDSVTSPHSRRAYDRALSDFFIQRKAHN